MHILVIDGAGYIGSHVVREFLDTGHRVSVLDNFSSGDRANLFPEAALIEADILDYTKLATILKKGFDAIIHLAAFKAAGESMILPEKYSVNNISGTINILNAMCDSTCRRIVFSSSAAVYGEPERLPIDESHPANPANYYGFTKLEIERILSWYERLKDIRYAALRYFNAAGYDELGRVKGLETNPGNLIPILMENAVGKRTLFEINGDDYDTPDGTCIRDYVHVSDLAAAHVLALESMVSTGKSLTVNLGSDKGYSNLEVLNAARKITGQAIPSRIVGRRAGDPAELYASSKLAGTLLGWKARRSSVENLVSTTWNAYQRAFHGSSN